MESEIALLKVMFIEMVDSPVLEEFASVWQEMGLTNDHKKTRRETIKVHLTNLLQEIVDEEISLKQKLEDSVAASKRELESLCEVLSPSVVLVSLVILSPTPLYLSIPTEGVARENKLGFKLVANSAFEKIYFFCSHLLTFLSMSENSC